MDKKRSGKYCLTRTLFLFAPLPPSLPLFVPLSRSLPSYLHLFYCIINPTCAQRTHSQLPPQKQTPQELDQHNNIFILLHTPVFLFPSSHLIPLFSHCIPSFSSSSGFVNRMQFAHVLQQMSSIKLYGTLLSLHDHVFYLFFAFLCLC